MKLFRKKTKHDQEMTRIIELLHTELESVYAMLRESEKSIVSVVNHPNLQDELETLLDQVERLLSDKNMWRNTCSKLVGMMLPFGMLMKADEIDNLKIILEEITIDSHTPLV